MAILVFLIGKSSVTCWYFVIGSMSAPISIRQSVSNKEFRKHLDKRLNVRERMEVLDLLSPDVRQIAINIQSNVNSQKWIITC